MTTGTEVIHDSLQKILVQADEQGYQPSEYQSGMRELNDMMTEWDALGYSLGFTLLTNITDTVTVPAGAIGGIKSNLAMRLAPEFDVEVTQGLAAQAKSGLQAVMNISVVVQPTQLPDTLNIGSGNEDEPYIDHFYPGVTDSVLTEDNGNILLESGTNGE